MSEWLFDDVLETAMRPPKVNYEDELLPPVALLDMDKLKVEMLKAERFVLDDDFVYAAFQLSQSRPSQLLMALNFARSPYQTIWLECTESEKKLDGKMVPPLSPISEPIDRVGYLLCCDDSGMKGTAHLFWRHKDKSLGNIFKIHGCIFSNEFDFDLTRNLDSDPQLIKNVLRESQMTDPKELDALAKLAPRFYLTLSSLAGQALKKSFYRAQFEPNLKSTFEKLFTNAINDWGGESRFILAVLCLLNSRNSSDSSSSTPVRTTDKINRRRISSGKLPLFSHKILKLKVSHQEEQSGELGEPGSNKRRAHLVRGHFKVRKSGLFWWRPHIAGSSEIGVVSKRYEVAAK